MMAWTRGTSGVAAFSVLALALAGCSDTTGGSQRYSANYLPQPQTLQPVQNSAVSSSSLPPIGGTQPSAGQVAPGLTGTPVLGGVSATTPTQSDPYGTQMASTDGSFTTVGAPDGVPPAGARDFTTGVSVDKLLGGWNVLSGASQCRLNLTQTAKTGTSRYRASAPACSIASLAGVASWALVGSGIQLFDEGGSIVGALQLSGNRFIGTAAGGAPISMSS